MQGVVGLGSRRWISTYQSSMSAFLYQKSAHRRVFRFSVSLARYVIAYIYGERFDGCIKPGAEENALDDLLYLAVQPHYELRSAFCRGSICGYIYLEATMNKYLVHLLRRIPGIRIGLTGVRYNCVPEEEWEALLVMQDVEVTPVKGDWVVISRGKYKGDFALVSSLEKWQGVNVLLIPRLPHRDSLPSSKRKKSTPRPTPQLFDPSLVPRDARIQPVELGENVYKYGSLRLENGLLRQSFDFHSISREVLSMPTEVLSAFRESGHVEMLATKFPCPLEFKFEEDELVTVLSRNTLGKIATSRPCEAEVELLNGEGFISVSWVDMRKQVEFGDFVVVLSGTHKGYEGFITGVKGHAVVVTEFFNERSSNTIDPHRVMKVRSLSQYRVVCRTESPEVGGSPRQLGQGHTFSLFICARSSRPPSCCCRYSIALDKLTSHYRKTGASNERMLSEGHRFDSPQKYIRSTTSSGEI